MARSVIVVKTEEEAKKVYTEKILPIIHSRYNSNKINDIENGKIVFYQERWLQTYYQLMKEEVIPLIIIQPNNNEEDAIDIDCSQVAYLKVNMNTKEFEIKVHPDSTKDKLEEYIAHETIRVRQLKNKNLAEKLNELINLVNNVQTEDDYKKIINHPLEKEANDYVISLMKKKEDFYAKNKSN